MSLCRFTSQRFSLVLSLLLAALLTLGMVPSAFAFNAEGANVLAGEESSSVSEEADDESTLEQLDEGVQPGVGATPGTDVGTNPGTSTDAESSAATSTPSTKPARIDISKVVLSIADLQWSGRQIKPTKFVYEGKAYSIKKHATIKSYGVNRNIGKGTIKITGKGIFKGTRTISFKIVPSTLVAPIVVVGAKKMEVFWDKLYWAQKISRYQMRYRAQGTSTWTTETYPASTTVVTIKKLTPGVKYEVQARSYKTIKKGTKSTKYYSAWSEKRTSVAVNDKGTKQSARTWTHLKPYLQSKLSKTDPKAGDCGVFVYQTLKNSSGYGIKTSYSWWTGNLWGELDEYRVGSFGPYKYSENAGQLMEKAAKGGLIQPGDIIVMSQGGWRSRNTVHTLIWGDYETSKTGDKGLWGPGGTGYHIYHQSLGKQGTWKSCVKEFYGKKYSPYRGFDRFRVYRITSAGGYIEVTKTVEDASNSETGDYSLDGAVIGIYASSADAKADRNRVATLKTDVNGYAKTNLLNAGTYHVKELEASTGLALNTKVFKVTIAKGGKSPTVVTVEIINAPAPPAPPDPGS